MELDYALIAESAEQFANGQLGMWGSDIEGIRGGGVPVLFQGTLVIRLILSPDEPAEGHTFRVELTGGQRGRQTLKPDTPINTIRNESQSHKPSAARVLLKLALGFATPGDYVFHVIVDGVE